MFCRKLGVTLRTGDQQVPVPKKWLENFFLRDFTGFRAFDETLPVADGLLEAGWQVPLEDLRQRFESWLLGRKMISPQMALIVTELDRQS